MEEIVHEAQDDVRFLAERADDHFDDTGGADDFLTFVRDEWIKEKLRLHAEWVTSGTRLGERADFIGIDLSDVPARPPLAVNRKLTESARRKCDEMAKHDYFAHTGVESSGSDGDDEVGQWLCGGWHRASSGGFDGRWVQLFPD